MVIDLKRISQDPRCFLSCLTPESWQEDGVDGRIAGLASPVEARLLLFRAGEKYVLEGHLSGRIRFRCDRCLDRFDRDMASDFRLCFSPAPAADAPVELELSEKDLSDDFITGDELDLDEVIREQIYFLVPIKCLCREACKGLCPVCGVNLNTGDCHCSTTSGHPAFQVLEGMKVD